MIRRTLRCCQFFMATLMLLAQSQRGEIELVVQSGGDNLSEDDDSLVVLPGSTQFVSVTNGVPRLRDLKTGAVIREWGWVKWGRAQLCEGKLALLQELERRVHFLDLGTTAENVVEISNERIEKILGISPNCDKAIFVTNSTPPKWGVMRLSDSAILWQLTGDPDEVKFSPNKQFIVALFAGRIEFRTPDLGRLLKGTLTFTDDAIGDLAFSDNSRWLGVKINDADDKSLLVWDLASGGSPRKIRLDPSVDVESYTFLPGDSGLVYAGGGNLYWRSLMEANRPVRSVFVDDKESRLAVSHIVPVGQGMRLLLSFTLSGAEHGHADAIGAVDLTATAGSPVELISSRPAITTTSAALHEMTSSLVLGQTDGYARQVDYKTGRTLQRFGPHGASVLAVAVSPDGNTVATLTDKHLSLWSALTGQMLNRTLVDGTKDLYYRLVFSQDGRYIAIAVGGIVQVVDVDTFKTTRQWLQGANRREPNPILSSDGRHVLFRITKTKSCAIFRTFSGEVQLALPFDCPPHSVFESPAAISRDEQYLAFTNRSGNIVIWDLKANHSVAETLKSTFDFEVTQLRFATEGHAIYAAALHGPPMEWRYEDEPDPESIGKDDSLFVLPVLSDKYLFLGGSSRLSLFDRKAKQVVLYWYHGIRDEWLTVTPGDHLFDANDLRGFDLVGWLDKRFPRDHLSLETYTREYFVPKLLTKIIHGEKFSAFKPVEDLSRVPPHLEEPQAGSSATDRVVINVKVGSQTSTVQKDKAGRPLQSGVYDVRLFRDGQLVGQWPEDAPGGATSSTGTLGETEREQWRQQHHVELDANGEAVIPFRNIQLPQRKGLDHVTFTAYAFNSDRVKSETSPPLVYKFSPPAQPRQRRAYVITMGVNATQASSPWDLSVAVPSAREASRLWRERLSKEYEVVEVNLMSEVDAEGAIARADATKANLRAILDVLAGREKQVSTAVRQAIDPQRKLRSATPDDAVVLYVASHGYADSQGRFFLVPFDTGTQRGIDERVLTSCQSKPDGSPLCGAAESFLSHAISSDDLAAWWSGVDGGEIVMVLDSCHSGAAAGQGFRPGPLGDRGFGQLAYDKGLRIFAATQPDKVARGTAVQGPATLLIEALNTAAATTEGQGIRSWLRTAERMLPQRARQLYPTLNEDDLQWPELMDFRQEPATVGSDAKRQ